MEREKERERGVKGRYKSGNRARERKERARHEDSRASVSEKSEIYWSFTGDSGLLAHSAAGVAHSLVTGMEERL